MDEEYGGIELRKTQHCDFKIALWLTEIESQFAVAQLIGLFPMHVYL